MKLETQIDFKNLLDEYRKLWKNRILFTEQVEEATIKEAIIRELKDENAHPRVRKTPLEKYYLATKRIIESELSEKSKLDLLKLHLELMDCTKQ